MKLLIISHTEHYKNTDGDIVGWSPTVSEINKLLEIFTEIYHAAMLHDCAAPPSSLAYASDKIKFVPLPVSGGQSLTSKFWIIKNAPKSISIISDTLKKVDYFQLRTPTGIGVYLIPYLTYFVNKKGWFKYAGNWNQKNAPFGYALQRFMLKRQKRKVTINGAWKDQPKHVITFENPCLTDENILEGQTVSNQKNYSEKLNFCYVGRLETPKGVGRIIEALKTLDNSEKQKIGDVHLVGDGKEKSQFENLALNSDINFIFHGFLDRERVFDIYKKSHYFLMPTTASEGFPKVIAEAMNFGCIPIVSNISSIAQYIKHAENGFILQDVTVNELHVLLKNLVSNYKTKESIRIADLAMIKRFSYNFYNSRIRENILLNKTT